MELEDLKSLLAKEPVYRFKQAKKALFCDLIGNWQEATCLSLALRDELNAKFPIGYGVKYSISESKDSIKALIVLKDGLKIETVLMRHEDGRNTVCVSSQVGCPLECVFCATGKMGFKRNLEALEIIEQVLLFGRYLKKEKQRVTNVVFMGMGEPFLNYENVLSAISILNDKEGFGLGQRRFSISTIGIVEGIERLAQEKLQVNLAISLHAPEDNLRLKIVPSAKKYPIRDILRAVDNYIKKTRRRVMLEYLMIKDLNDSQKDAEKLASIACRPLCFVNLISYNPTGIFKSSPQARIKKFKEFLSDRGVSVTQRFRFGEDIDAACGQLAGK